MDEAAKFLIWLTVCFQSRRLARWIVDDFKGQMETIFMVDDDSDDDDEEAGDESSMPRNPVKNMQARRSVKFAK